MESVKLIRYRLYQWLGLPEAEAIEPERFDGTGLEHLPGLLALPDIRWTLINLGLYYTRQERAGKIGFFQFADGGTKLLLRAAGNEPWNDQPHGVARPTVVAVRTTGSPDE
jgi:hypothetical protein